MSELRGSDSTPTMTAGVDPAIDCGCCEGTEPITPEPTANRPGLNELSYRIGTHAAFLETMTARLSSHRLTGPKNRNGGDETRPLAFLTTRDGSDPSIGLLDAWATVGDVLTFYQERIANEGYLRTATERRSVTELARLVGYAPRPGVAASTYLAYTIDENEKEEVLIPAGARVQSIAGPDELPQSFETGEDLRARAAWNRLVPRQTEPQHWSMISNNGRLYLKGIATDLKPNDPLLIDRGANRPHLVRVIAVSPDTTADRTEVTIEPWAIVGATETNAGNILAMAEHLIESAPEGRTADQFVEKLRAVGQVTANAENSRVLLDLLDNETLPSLNMLIESVSGPATRLRPWLASARTALMEARDTISRAVAGEKTVPLTERLNSFMKKPSVPLANALRMPRTLQSSFRSTSDAGLKTLSLASLDLRENLGSLIASHDKTNAEPELKVYALRLKAGLFGRNAPKQQKTVRLTGSQGSDEAFKTEPIGEWPIIAMRDGEAPTETPTTIFLDSNYDSILPGTWVVVDCSAVTEFLPGEHVNIEPAAFELGRQSGSEIFPKFLIARVKEVAPKVARAEYGISGDTVRIDLNMPWFRRIVSGGNVVEADTGQAVIDRDFQIIRSTAIYAASERMELAEAPIEMPVCNGASETEPLELDGLYQDIEPGRFVMVSGERTDIADTSNVFATEAAMIAEVNHDVRSSDTDTALHGERKHTFILLDRPLSYCYRRDSVTVYGNVVKATHGETRQETLGNGDGAKALQSFTLKQTPLTHLAAPTAIGADSTLQVFINDVRWREETSFVGIAATDRVFVSKTDDSDETIVTFGNGSEGARLPSGIENVKAVYRTGIGKPGNLRAGQLSQLSTKPLGVKEVINPLRASGGANREGRDQVRRNAPLAVMALDRLVSTPDYADFARSFAGIGKADAAELSDGRRNVVHVTIAGIDDIPIDPASDLFRNLRRALVDLGDPFQPVQLATRNLLILVISARLRIEPDHRWESVVTKVRAKLLETFGFERRELAQDVTSSEVLRAIHSVRGITYVDLEAFGTVPSTITDPNSEDGQRPRAPHEIAAEIERIVSNPPAPRVLAESARVEATGIQPAQLATLVAEVPATLILNQITD
ncbi:MAG: putative baseplate assembly protein [Geminicoccaceae bacterium]